MHRQPPPPEAFLGRRGRDSGHPRARHGRHRPLQGGQRQLWPRAGRHGVTRVGRAVGRRNPLGPGRRTLRGRRVRFRHAWRRSCRSGELRRAHAAKVASHPWAELDPRLAVTISLGVSSGRSDEWPSVLAEADRLFTWSSAVAATVSRWPPGRWSRQRVDYGRLRRGLHRCREGWLHLSDRKLGTDEFSLIDRTFLGCGIDSVGEGLKTVPCTPPLSGIQLSGSSSVNSAVSSLGHRMKVVQTLPSTSARSGQKSRPVWRYDQWYDYREDSREPSY